jgi:SAM-dependent methyltransferase
MKTLPLTPWEDQFYDPALFDAAAGDAYSNEVEERYFQLIGSSPKKIVEFGCGTGRVILKLAARGHEVTGIDISEKMLEYLWKKVDGLPVEMKGRIKTVCANGSDSTVSDMHNQVSGKFNLAIAVDDFLTHFLDKEKLAGIFTQIASCLEPGSLFITDLRIRDGEKLRRAQHDYPKNMYTYGIVHGVRVDKEIFSASMKYWEDFDTTNNVLCSHQVFDFIRKDGEVEKTVYKTLQQKLLTSEELKTIAGRANFALQQFVPFDIHKDENAGIYIFRFND